MDNTYVYTFDGTVKPITFVDVGGNNATWANIGKWTNVTYVLGQ